MCTLLQVRLRALVGGALDVAGASPRRYFFEVLRHFATDEREQERLQYLSTPEGRNDLYTYNQREGATGQPCLPLNEDAYWCYARLGRSVCEDELRFGLYEPCKSCLSLETRQLGTASKYCVLRVDSRLYMMCRQVAQCWRCSRTSRARRCRWSGCCRWRPACSRAFSPLPRPRRHIQGAAHITAAIVNWRTPFKRLRKVLRTAPVLFQLRATVNFYYTRCRYVTNLAACYSYCAKDAS